MGWWKRGAGGVEIALGVYGEIGTAGLATPAAVIAAGSGISGILSGYRSVYGEQVSKNFDLEAKVVREGNQIVHDLLLTKGHLTPRHLMSDACTLVEHYDVCWRSLTVYAAITQLATTSSRRI
jgi:hypothetical protein